MFKLIIRCMVSISVLMNSFVAWADNGYMSEPDFIAQATVNYVNRFKTLDDMLKDLKRFLPAAQVTELKSKFEAQGVAMSYPLSQYKAEGANIFTKNMKMTILDGGKVRFQGRTFDLLNKSPSEIFDLVIEKLKPRSTAMLFLPEAQALAGLAPEVIEFLITTGAAPVVALGAAVIYLGNLGYEWLRDGEPYCTDDGMFSVRKRKPGNLGFQTNESFVLSPKTVGSIIRRVVTSCDPAVFAELQKKMRTMPIDEIKYEQYLEKGGGAK